MRAIPFVFPLSHNRAGRALAWFAAVVPVFGIASCGRYRDFSLPALEGQPTAVTWTWQAESAPVLEPGPSGEWDSSDTLNPSVFPFASGLFNLYSGFDGKTWHTGLAISADGGHWSKQGRVLSPGPAAWEGDYIAANGSAIVDGGTIRYYYQAGQPPRIGAATSSDARRWSKLPGAVLDAGPYETWDERGVADPYVVRFGPRFYLFYTGMDRARRQRLGVAVSGDGVIWTKLRANPILELGEYGDFDENGLGEPAVWTSRGWYWMLYTGRDRRENRRMGLARSRDGVHWTKQPPVIAGAEPWDAKVVCDPSVLADGDAVRVWFGGGDVARPDERIHGRIGVATLRANYSNR